MVSSFSGRQGSSPFEETAKGTRRLGLPLRNLLALSGLEPSRHLLGLRLAGDPLAPPERSGRDLPPDEGLAEVPFRLPQVVRPAEHTEIPVIVTPRRGMGLDVVDGQPGPLPAAAAAGPAVLALVAGPLEDQRPGRGRNVAGA